MCLDNSILQSNLQSAGVISSKTKDSGVIQSITKLSDLFPSDISDYFDALHGREEYSADKEAGLSMGHNSPFSNSGYLQVYKKGGLITAQREKSKFVMRKKGGGKREKITKFTKKSRWRFMQKIGMIEKKIMPVFVTLTYPDDYPQSKEVWANHLDRLGKRFSRRGWSAIVRKEFVRRKSGVNVGRLVPHYHLLVWGAKYEDLRKYVSKAWYKIVDSKDIRHFYAGVRVENLRSWHGVLFYVSKYMAKQTEEDLITEFPQGVGRFWSVINEDGIPWAEIERVNASDKEIINIFRLMRRYTRAKKTYSSNRSMSILCNEPEFWLKLLE